MSREANPSIPGVLTCNLLRRARRGLDDLTPVVEHEISTHRKGDEVSGVVALHAPEQLSKHANVSGEQLKGALRDRVARSCS